MRSSKSNPFGVYKTLLKTYGTQNWWPVDRDYHLREGTDPREEVVIGAVLTQNTAWRNVEKALENLKRERVLSFRAILDMPLERLQELIRPSGYFRQKAQRLKVVAKALTPVEKVESITREELLRIKGVGKETADVILLYAGNRPSFVIDAYTKRVAKRLWNIEGSYDELKSWFESLLPRDLEVYKEFHALLDEHAKRQCKPKPLCDKCPLGKICVYNASLM